METTSLHPRNMSSFSYLCIILHSDVFIFTFIERVITMDFFFFFRIKKEKRKKKGMLCVYECVCTQVDEVPKIEDFILFNLT